MEAIATTNPLQSPTNLTTLTSKSHYPQTTVPQFLNFTSSNTLFKPKPKPKPKNTVLILTNCSTKSNTNQENATPISNIREQGTPNSSSQLSSNSSLSRGLIFGLGQENSWDCVEIGSPVVKRFLSDDEERWYMWYHGMSDKNSDSIGLAVSSNGIHWERGVGAAESNDDVGLVMKRSEDWWTFDIYGVRPCEMVIMSSAKVRVNSAVYWLYYTGFCSEKLEKNVHFGDENGETRRSLPGLAMSQDGRHWARIEGEHHSGALFDVGLEGEWDSLFIASPQVVFHGSGDIRMYYHSFDVENGYFAVGMARSRDGMKWMKLGKIMGGGAKGAFDERGVVNTRVLRNRKDGKYLMVYEGVGGNGRRSIGMAVSDDGLKDWKRVQDSPVFEQSGEGGWDSEGVGMPCLVHMDGDRDEWRLYYRGIGKEGRSGIGLAVSQGSEVNSFERWTGFHL